MSLVDDMKENRELVSVTATDLRIARTKAEDPKQK
jgi:hypothetical protein